MLRTDLGERLHRRRIELGMSLEQVADAARIEPEYLRYLEEQPGWPTRETLLRLATVLRMNPSALLGYTERREETLTVAAAAGAGRSRMAPG